jgi:hypothetical protein
VPRYFFHLSGGFPAHDRIGHDCEDDSQARDDALRVAQRYRIERPKMFQANDLISVTNENGVELFQVPLLAATV